MSQVEWDSGDELEEKPFNRDYMKRLLIRASISPA